MRENPLCAVLKTVEFSYSWNTYEKWTLILTKQSLSIGTTLLKSKGKYDVDSVSAQSDTLDILDSTESVKVIKNLRQPHCGTTNPLCGLSQMEGISTPDTAIIMEGRNPLLVNID